ncbi:MAG: carboxylating nicotinate-nucleotide diphosphorylase [Puniceicoccaceae bacterium]|nr:carboxylating nicotinate-nucleotide diphosphorylase [Puniceicoccaceae bacterium]
MSHEARYSKDTFQTRLKWQDLDPDYLRQLVGLAKIEDLAGAGLANRPERLGDVTTALMPESAMGKAQLIARESLVVCGLSLVQTTLDSYGQDCQFEATAEDGQSVGHGEVIGILSGSSTVLLQAERVILNFLQHLSGVATEARLYVDALGSSPAVLLDTRKTLPGYRVLQKYAFACGGGYNHRIGLFDRVMLKDNHLAVAGAIGGNRLSKTVALAVNTCEGLAIEVEVDRIEQITPALEAGADIILLDNFSPPELKEAVSMIDGRAWTEASGGITIDSLPDLGDLGLDFISTGAPIHQSRWKDIGLDWL